MLGVNLLVRLGRQVLKGPVVDSGLLPASCYRHLTLAALEEDNFPGALEYLEWAGDPLLAQILILRLRLLAVKHGRQRQVLVDLLRQGPPEERRRQYHELLNASDRALELLSRYEAQAVAELT